MDILSPPKPKAEIAKPGVWPAAPAVDGKYYYVTDQFGAKCAAMTLRTFETLGTIMEQQKRTLAIQDEKIKQIERINKQLVADKDAMLLNLNNLREKRRSEKRAEIEGGLITPGDPRFVLSPLKK